MRESSLLNYLIRLAFRDALTMEVLDEWRSLLPMDAMIQQSLYDQLGMFMDRSQGGYAFAVVIVTCCLLFMRSKPNLHQIEVLLTPCVHDEATAETANAILCMVCEALNVLYQQLKEVQQRIVELVHRSMASLDPSHIDLFSTNLDESLLCSSEELFAPCGLFVSLDDPVVVRLRKLVINQCVLVGDEGCITLLSELDRAVHHMNEMAGMVPLVVMMRLVTRYAVEAGCGHVMSGQSFSEKSVLEVSLLVWQGLVDATQVPNHTVVVGVSMVSALVRSVSEFIVNGMEWNV